MDDFKALDASHPRSIPEIRAIVLSSRKISIGSGHLTLEDAQRLSKWLADAVTALKGAS